MGFSCYSCTSPSAISQGLTCGSLCMGAEREAPAHLVSHTEPRVAARGNLIYLQGWGGGETFYFLQHLLCRLAAACGPSSGAFLLLELQVTQEQSKLGLHDTAPEEMHRLSAATSQHPEAPGTLLGDNLAGASDPHISESEPSA